MITPSDHFTQPFQALLSLHLILTLDIGTLMVITIIMHGTAQMQLDAYKVSKHVCEQILM